MKKKIILNKLLMKSSTQAYYTSLSVINTRLLDCLLSSYYHTTSYFYDNKVLCEKQSNHRMSPNAESKIIVSLSIRY